VAIVAAERRCKPFVSYLDVVIWKTGQVRGVCLFSDVCEGLKGPQDVLVRMIDDPVPEL
jgi:hypothetical protein